MDVDVNAPMNLGILFYFLKGPKMLLVAPIILRFLILRKSIVIYISNSIIRKTFMCYVPLSPAVYRMQLIKGSHVSLQV